VSVITSISIDHTAWLGNTVEQIAVEKAGIARRDRPCLLGLRQPPDSLVSALKDTGANVEMLGREFDYRVNGGAEWCFQSVSFQNADERQPDSVTMDHLPLPFGQRGVQLDNAALAIQASRHLKDQLPVSVDSVRCGLPLASIAGRCQIIQRCPLVVVDVSHNEASVARLADFLREQEVEGRVFALCGMLRDKEIANALSILVPLVEHWSFVSIAGERGSQAEELLHIFNTQLAGDGSGAQVTTADTAEQAYRALLPTLTDDDCVLVFGSFFVASDILRVHENATHF
jgi:dihydrofolate synthase/folylpolyglutamate synthase